MRVRESLAILGAVFLMGSCSSDGSSTAEDASPTSASETARTESTAATESTATPAPPAAGEPGTVSLVFSDETETSLGEVSCQLEPAGEFATVAETPFTGSTPFFGVTLWTDPDRLAEASWRPDGDENWLAGGPVGSELEVSVDASTITGTAVFKSPTGQEIAGAFTIACPT